MSNVEQLPTTLGKINKQLKSLKAATANAWQTFTTLPKKSLYNAMSEDISDVIWELRSLDNQSRPLAHFLKPHVELSAGDPESVKPAKPVNPYASERRNAESISAGRRGVIEQKGMEPGEQFTHREEIIGQLKSASSDAISFALPQLELAKNFLKPGADLQVSLSELQSVLGLQKEDPRVAALRQQSLSMATSGHSPADVVAAQKKLADSGLDATQVLAQTPGELNGSTPAAQTAITVKGDNLDGDITKLFATWDTLRINLFEGQSAALRELTQTATQWLTTLNTWITDNPQLVNALLGMALGITGVIGGLGSLGMAIAPVLSGVNMMMAGAGLLGTVFTSTGGVIAAAFTAIGLPLLPVIALIAGIGIAVVKLWEPISAFVSGMIAGFSSVMGPLSNAFAPFKSALSWITDLLAPIKFTQDELRGYTDIGKLVGAAIGEIFVTLNKAVSQIGEVFNWARKSVDSVLNIFSSDNDEQTEAQNPPAAFNPALSATGGTLSLYQPAKASVANSLTDNRTTTMNVSFTATPETDYQQIQSFITRTLNERDWNNENAQHSVFDNGGFYS